MIVRVRGGSAVQLLEIIQVRGANRHTEISRAGLYQRLERQLLLLLADVPAVAAGARHSATVVTRRFRPRGWCACD